MIGNTLEIVLHDEDERYTRVSFWGNLDSFGLSEKRKEIMGTVDAMSKKWLVFDFTDLSFLNSESIGFLMQVNENLMENGKNLVLINAKKNVLDVLQVIGLLETMSYYKDLEEFISSIENAN